MQALNDKINADLKARKEDLLAMALDALEDDIEPPARLQITTESNGVEVLVTMDFASGEEISFQRAKVEHT